MPPRGPSIRVLAAVGLVAACTLAFQVLLTRLLSAVMAYHFSFLAVSLGLTGTGAGALLVYVVPRLFRPASLERELSRWCVAYSALLLVTPLALVRLDFTGGGGVNNRGISSEFVLSLTAACLLAALPSLAAGIVIALAINGYSSSVGRVYAFDLIGAGTGAVVIVPLMWALDAPTLLVGLGGVAAVAGLLFAPAGSRERWSSAGVNGVASVLASVFGVALAVTFGFAVTSLVAGACYVAALIHAIVGRWPDRLPEVALAQRSSEEDRPAAVVATVATVRP